jgi:EAL domain
MLRADAVNTSGLFSGNRLNRDPIDDLGIGYSGLRMWSELRPDFVKIDRYFISGIDSDPVKLEFVRSIVAMGRAVGSYIIAEGVETIQECREVFDLDVDAAQGFLFAKPAFPVASDREVLVLDSKPIAPGMLVRDFVKLLREQTHRDAFPVVDANNEPLGMVWRNSFLLRYSRPLQPELLNKRPVLEIMDVEALADHRLARTHHPGKGSGPRRTAIPSSVRRRRLPATACWRRGSAAM